MKFQYVNRKDKYNNYRKAAFSFSKVLLFDSIFPMKWLFFLFFIPQAFSAILGPTDDRAPISEQSSEIQNLASSAPALIQNFRLQPKNKEITALLGMPLIEKMNMCQYERFSEESITANCSASLIAPDLVLTAAHCLAGEDYQCQTYSVVFDYHGKEVLNKNIYKCSEVKFFSFDLKNPGIDLAVIKLDRPVKGRKPVKLSTQLKKGEELFMIGYPLGTSQKITTNGFVKSIDRPLYSFRHTLDSFSVNSGGPIFNSKHEQVGVLVRGTGSNLVKNEAADCYEWGTESEEKGFSDGNLVFPIVDFLKSRE